MSPTSADAPACCLPPAPPSAARGQALRRLLGRLGLASFLALVFGVMAVAPAAQATHNFGGELTYEWRGANKYRFILTFYRDCTGTTQATTGLQLENGGVPGLLASYPFTHLGTNDISPECNQFTGGPPQINCPTPSNSSGTSSSGSVERNRYVTADIDFSAVPAIPTGGYLFYVHPACCRNTNDNTACSQGEMYFRAIMYPYIVGGVSQKPIDPNYRDTSPRFAEPPTTLLVQSNTDTFCFSNNAIDINLDNLLYDFADPAIDVVAGAIVPCGYPAPPTPYNAGNRLPGLLSPYPDPVSGQICFIPNMAGKFLACIVVRSYRCGQLISEVFRDFQMITILAPSNYGVNERPSLDTPFVYDNGSRGYIDTFYAGDTIQFGLIAIDLAGYAYNIGKYQDIDIYFNGIEFGAGYSSQTTGCPYPPCATLSQPSTGNPPVPIVHRPDPVTGAGDTLGYGYSDNTINGGTLPVTFYWPTSCANLPLNDCGVIESVFNFVATAKDDYCPVNGKFIQPITIVLQPAKVPSPKGLCLHPQASGAVQMEWQQPVDTRNQFYSYDIYRGVAPGGPFTRLDSVMSITTLTYTDATALPNSLYYYYVRARGGCYNLASDAYDTVSTILVTAVGGAGGAGLTWNDPYAAMANTPAGKGPYLVLRRVRPATAWDTAASLNYPANPTTFFDSLSLCDDSVEYMIALYNAQGNCFQTSAPAGARVGDTSNVPPTIATVISVDTTDNGRIRIEWLPNAAADTKGYLITRLTCGTNIIEAQYTVLGRYNNFYIDTVPADLRPYCYTVAGFDSCFSDTAPGLQSLTHSQVLLTQSLNRCDGVVSLDWTQYKGFLTGVASYTVKRVGIPSNSVAVLATLGNTDFAWEDSTIVKGERYCYVIETTDSSGLLTSLSNKVCVQSSIFAVPAFSQVRYATVNPDNTVTVAFAVDTLADVSHYLVQRSDAGPLGTYETIATVGPFGTGTGTGTRPATLSYTDVSAEPDYISHTYRIIVVDSCDREVLVSSNYGKTILLEGESDHEFNNSIRYTAYEQWPGGVASYLILRRIPKSVDSLWAPYKQVFQDTLSIVDNVVDYIETEGKFCYQIIAVENGPNTLGYSDSASSNVLCVVQPPRIYAPTVVVPIGVNKLWRPQLVFAEPSSYNMRIYNRWGEMVYTSNDPAAGWGGTYKSGEAPQGVYIWEVFYTGRNGEAKQERGTVMVVR